MSPEQLLSLWLTMLELAGKGSDKEFRNAQDYFTRCYKRCDYSVQGEFHHMLALDHKAWVENNRGGLLWIN